LQLLYTFLSQSDEAKYRNLREPENSLWESITRSWLLSNSGLKTVSSYRKNIRVALNFKNHTVCLSQRYPGGNNCTWTIGHGDERMEVFNPDINDSVQRLVPRSFRSRLLEYRSLDFILDYYFWSFRNR
jgi:hypothetical protein